MKAKIIFLCVFGLGIVHCSKLISGAVRDRAESPDLGDQSPTVPVPAPAYPVEATPVVPISSPSGEASPGPSQTAPVDQGSFGENDGEPATRLPRGGPSGSS